jgi:hypothetical protein
MALFSYKCPKCGQFSLTDPNGSCQNKFKDGNTCGYQLAFKFELGNRPFRSKVEKHTTPPAAITAGTWSWVDSKEKYSLFHEMTLKRGSLNLDQANNHLFLWHTPSGSTAIAHVIYGEAGTTGSVSGVVSPLNSKLQNIHSHFDNWNDNWTQIAVGHNLIIEEPHPEHPDTYTVSSDKELIAWFNPYTKKFWNDK